MDPKHVGTDFTVKNLYCIVNKRCAFVGLRNVSSNENARCEQYKITLGRSRHRWENNIQMDLKEIGYEGVSWIKLVQGTEKRWALVMAAWFFILSSSLIVRPLDTIQSGAQAT
jgi:hypothetical protein